MWPPVMVPRQKRHGWLMTTNMGSFLVCIDDGAELLVTVRQHWEKITPLSGISEWIPTTRSYKLANGYSLNSSTMMPFKSSKREKSSDVSGESNELSASAKLKRLTEQVAPRHLCLPFGR
jgi:hypothetical protein